MGREIRLYDPQTGRSLILYERPEGQIVQQQDYPVATQQSYPPPAQYQPYYPPAPYQQRGYRPRKSKFHRREEKAKSFASFLAVFVLSFIPAATGSPGGTLVIWGLGLAFLIYRTFR